MRHDRLNTMRPASVFLWAVALLVSCGWAHAAIECGDEECVYVVVELNRVTEDPDPILMWEEFSEGLGHPLNPGGEARGDGPADLALDPATGLPFVTWAYNIGSSFEIAFTQWSYEGWRVIDLLTADAWNDLDPQIAVGMDWTAYVVWWHDESGVSDIRMTTRDPDTGRFEIPWVLAPSGRRPSVVFAAGTLIVGYERPLPNGRQEVVVLHKRPGEPPTEKVIATVYRREPLKVYLEKEHGYVWMYWHHTDSLAGYTEYEDGEWGASPESFQNGSGGETGDPTNIELGPRR